MADEQPREEMETANAATPVRKSRKVLLAIDGSEGCKKAFDWYLENMWHSTDTVLLVHIFSPPSLPTYAFATPGGGFFIPDAYRDSVEAARTKSHKLVGEYESVFKTRNMPYRSIVESGTPGESICAIAETEEADSIVVGSRGLGLLRRTFLGSVSDYILHHVHVPVSIVPGK